MLNRLHVGLTIALLAGGLVACGGKDDNGGPSGGAGEAGGPSADTGGNGGDATTTGGRSGTGGRTSGGTTGSGGNAGETTTGGAAGGPTTTGGAAGGPTTTGGSAGEPPTSGGASGTGGASGGSSGTGGATGGDSIDDLIAAICNFEFGCCNAGELTYRLGPAAVSAAECTERFQFQYHESNQTNNPHPAGAGTGLLGTLGYLVNPARVVENPDGIAACIAAYAGMECPTGAAAPTHCQGTVIPGADPCALVNLFQPNLELDDECTLALAEGQGNDVECPEGSTCVAGGTPDNPGTTDVCVQRGTAGQPCTNDGDCDWNHYCNATGDCTPKGEAGDVCSFEDPDNPAPNEEDAQCSAGYRCSPETLTCVANCDTDYPCMSDGECPDLESCVPITVGSDSTTWHACRAIGETAAVRCDDNADCAEDRRCGGGVCASDLDIDDPCTVDSDCELGSFCDTATLDADRVARVALGVCTVYFNAGDPCFPGGGATYNSGCNPNDVPECVYTVDGYICSTEKLQEGDVCYPYSAEIAGEPPECDQGLDCEFASTSAAGYTCTVGADLGQNCDDVRSDGTALLCGVGLFCNPATDRCVAQVDPGEECESSGGGSAESGLCRNNSCVPNWDDSSTAPDFICTDAAVPVRNDGDGLICNGE